MNTLLLFMVKKILALIPTAIAVMVLVSCLIHFVPGNPVDRILGDFASGEERQALQEKLGLDKPLATQIFLYSKKLLRFDLGESLIYNKSVTQLIKERYKPTVELALLAILFAIFLSLPLGIIAALRANSWVDYFAMGVALLGVAIPNFWMGPMLVLLFSIHLNWLPVSGYESMFSYILPVITLGTALASILSRMVRNSFLDNLSEDYVKTAKAKGATESRIVFKHILKNAGLPLITIVGLQFGVLLTGAIVTERVFDWPGLGSLMINAIENRDYPLVQGLVLLFAFTYMSINLITDLAYAVIDPRIRLS